MARFLQCHPNQMGVLHHEGHWHVGDSTHVLLPWLEFVRPLLSSARCPDPEFGCGAEQRRQEERAQSAAPGESPARLEAPSCSPRPVCVTPTPQLTRLLPPIHFPGEWSRQLLGSWQSHTCRTGLALATRFPETEPVLVVASLPGPALCSSPGTKSPLVRLPMLWQHMG